MPTIRWLILVVFSLAFGLGSFKTLLEGLLSGQFQFARRGPPLTLDANPALYGLGVVVLITFALGLIFFAWATYQQGPSVNERPHQEPSRRGRRRVAEKEPPTLPAVLGKFAVSVFAVVGFAPFSAGLSVLIGSALARAVYALWTLAFVLWVIGNVWRWLHRGT